MRLAPGTRLGSYEIVSPLGAGGMGEVYRARDAKLRREVAIKVLPETTANDPEARARFEREALSVAALSHPNILAIHDFGVENGMAYAVTELLEGETLRSRLARGPVPPSLAIGYALQIAAGLSAAHAKGIVHRDLKPENLFLLRDDHVKILDFGLARRTPPSAAFDETPTSAPTAELTGGPETSPGRVMGTLAYMPPEQLRGKAVDARSDIFSFGAILYEMIAGRPAFRRDAPADTMAAILTAEAPALSESEPLALDRLVRHCLEKDPRNRFQSARDVAYALGEASKSFDLAVAPVVVTTGGTHFSHPPAARSLALAGGAAVVLVLVVLALKGFSQRISPRWSGTAAEKSAATRIAVLPFENLGPPAEDYFVDGIADAVRAKMTSVPGIQVIARASSVSYRKTKKSQREIAGELDTPYLLTATVRWEKSAGRDRVRVIPELVEVGEGGAPSSKWQQPFDASLTDVFEVQGEIATRVVQELGVALGSHDRKRLAGGFTKNVAAYDAFLRGEEEWYAKYSEGAAPDIRKGLGDYETAVALDPQFAEAWARIAEVNSALYQASTPDPEIPRRAREAAEKAVALAPDRPAGYVARANYFSTVSHDNSRALEDLAAARRLDPGSAEIINTIGDALLAKGGWEESIRLHREAEKLDPRTASHLGGLLMNVRRYTEAASVVDRQLAALPGNFTLLMSRTLIYLAQGDLAGARRFLGSARNVEQTRLIVELAQVFDLVWVLDDTQRALLLRLTPSAFDDNKPAWALALAQASALSHDAPGVKRYAEEANRALEEQIRLQPDNPDWHIYRGVALAYLGRRDEAIREGKRGCELLPISRDAATGAYCQHLLVRIYIMAGQPDRAIDALEPLLRIPYVLSPGWLRIDPTFDPLRGNPRFEKLVSAPV